MNTLHKPIIYIGLITTLCLWAACGSNDFTIDTSGIDTDITIHRLDQAMFEPNPDSLSAYIPAMENEYGDFLELVCSQILNIGGTQRPNFAKELGYFTGHPDMRQLYEKTQEVYPDLAKLEGELEDAFAHYTYYFPNQNLPEVYTYISGLNYGAITFENNLGIGLDMYLGVDYPVYEKAGIYKYKQAKMHSGRIVPDCMEAWAEAQFPFNDSIADMLSHMIHEGKKMYFIYSMLPDVPDSLKFGYTAMQYNWCESYEENIWTFFIEDNRLFNNDRLEIAKFINDAPFTAAFHNNSAPRTGVFIGFKIVQSFMKRHPEYTLERLMNETDYHSVLTLSGYNP